MLLEVATVTSNPPSQHRSSPARAVTPFAVTVVGEALELVFVAVVPPTGGLVVSLPLHAKQRTTQEKVEPPDLVTVKLSPPAASFHATPIV